MPSLRIQAAQSEAGGVHERVRGEERRLEDPGGRVRRDALLEPVDEGAGQHGPGHDPAPILAYAHAFPAVEERP